MSLSCAAFISLKLSVGSATVFALDLSRSQKSAFFFSPCRVTSVPLMGFILHQNVMRQSTVGLSMVDSNPHSSNNSRVVLQPPHQDSRIHTISSVVAARILVPIAVQLSRAISSHFLLAVSVCREQQGPMLSQTCPLI